MSANMGNIGESLSKVFQDLNIAGSAADALEVSSERQVESKKALQEDAQTAELPFKKLKTKSISNEKRTQKITKLEKEKVVGGVDKNQKQKEKSANNFQARNPEMKSEKLLKILAKLKGKASSAEILEALHAEFKDPVLIHEAMNFLLENSAEEDPDLHQAVQNTQDQYFISHEKEIRAGINIGAVVLKYAKTPEKAPELRSLYNDITGNPREAKDLFNELAVKYTYKEMTNAISFLFNALGKDLNSEGSSIEPGLLKNLIEESKNLQAIVGAYRCFKESMPLLEKRFAENDEPVPQRVNFQSMAKDFISFLGDRYPTSDKVLSSADKMGATTIAAKIIILETGRNAVNNVSSRLYNNPEQHRGEVKTAYIDALEKLYQDEEFEEDQTTSDTNTSHLTQLDVEPEKIEKAPESEKVVFFKNIFDDTEKDKNAPAA